MIDYNNKRFIPISSTGNSEVTSDTIFIYRQKGNVLTSTYKGETIIEGHLIGLVSTNGVINMRYHQINKNGELMTGTCISKPKVGSDGKITLYESWQWTSGDKSEGTSILKEI